MTKEYLSPAIVNMLRLMEAVFRQHNIDFYLVGAVARDVHLSAKPEHKPLRATKDVDIAILVASEDEFYKVKESLLATGLFKAHPIEPIKLFHNHIEVDLLPFGGIENNKRETRINNPSAFIMSMPGFQEAYSSVITVSMPEMDINICPLEGIILLKLIANDDRPSRTKDITDIEHIVKAYFDLNAEHIYADHFTVMDLYDIGLKNYLELVSARVIGRKIDELLAGSKGIKTRLEGILNKRPTAIWQAMLDGLTDRVPELS